MRQMTYLKMQSETETSQNRVGDLGGDKVNVKKI